MNAKKSKKVLLLASLSALAVSTAAVMAISFNSEAAYRAKATTGVSSSIVFSRDSGTFTKIDDSTASVSGKSFTGATYYAVSHNNADISTTNYVAQFGSKISDERYVSFSTSPTGTDDFEFEAITGIKVWTTSSSAQTMYLGYSSDGTSFSDVETISASTNPDKYTFSESHKFVRLFGYSIYARYVTKIELFYDCGSEPEQATPDHIAVYNAKNMYEFGDSFVKPEVRMIFSDESTEVIPSEKVTCTGYDMETLGEQTVTVSAEYDSVLYETTYKITVYIPTLYTISYNMLDASSIEYVNIHDYIDDVDALPPSFEEGSDVEMEIILSTDEYEVVWLSIEEDGSWDSFSGVDGVNFTLTNLPSKNITLTIWIAPAE